jgi:hypothetical protein
VEPVGTDHIDYNESGEEVSGLRYTLLAGLPAMAAWPARFFGMQSAKVAHTGT